MMLSSVFCVKERDKTWEEVNLTTLQACEGCEGLCSDKAAVSASRGSVFLQPQQLRQGG